jgi:hypothetical protein
MKRDPIIEAHWTLVGTAPDTDSIYSVCQLAENEVDEHVLFLTERGWNVHVYKPVLDRIVPALD